MRAHHRGRGGVTTAVLLVNSPHKMAAYRPLLSPPALV